MSLEVYLAVLGAAVLHATWNALVKRGGDKRVSMGAVVLGHIPFAVGAIVVSAPPDLASLPYLVVGIALHLGYQLFLLRSYDAGELTQVYPIARGSAPMIVAAISVAFLGVHLSTRELLAVGLIATGILSLSIVRHTDGQRNPTAGGLALVTGAFIAAYSLNDGLGARVAGTSLGFYGWLALLNGLAMAGFLRWRAPDALRQIARETRGTMLLGGGASFLAYAAVTWAFTQAPIALVAALRETSIVFALLIGVLVLNERLNLAKVVSIMATLVGAALVRYAR